MGFISIATGLKVSEEVPILKKAEVVFFEMSVRFVRTYDIHMKVDGHF
jgi:hypothetical protein